MAKMNAHQVMYIHAFNRLRFHWSRGGCCLSAATSQAWNLAFTLRVYDMLTQCCGEEGRLHGQVIFPRFFPDARGLLSFRWPPLSQPGFGARGSGFQKMYPGLTWSTLQPGWSTPTWGTSCCAPCLWLWGFYSSDGCSRGETFVSCSALFVCASSFFFCCLRPAAEAHFCKPIIYKLKTAATFLRNESTS